MAALSGTRAATYSPLAMILESHPAPNGLTAAQWDDLLLWDARGRIAAIQTQHRQAKIAKHILDAIKYAGIAAGLVVIARKFLLPPPAQASQPFQNHPILFCMFFAVAIFFVGLAAFVAIDGIDEQLGIGHAKLSSSVCWAYAVGCVVLCAILVGVAIWALFPFA